ncbi:TrbI/VirB10 family protein [Nitrosovibrio sp. Nv6]|uniref:TrbI/VirB10 family protein n=1 Tax=Nitrosovibrio sp. Nv6 TaxID=1855340 RepID=UPI0008C387E1|nr:TrbI/VirB10 family protein [Nitrosovibrio sp. Nv6]SEP43188.1 Type IV secretory pathway, VirB10 components [Nitrosovibrio sp. Nv6]
MATFDLKRPATSSEWKKTAVWLGGASLVAAAILGGAAYYKSDAPVLKPRIAIGKGFDEGFFSAPTAAPEPEPVNDQKPVVPELVVSESSTTPALKAKDLFAVDPVPAKPAVSPVDALNQARRGTGAVRVAGDGSGENEDQFLNMEKDWGEKKTVASYPMNLERIIPVTRRIGAVLVEAIHSELDGKVTAQIEENIYAAHGRNILIPAGSQAVGRYRSLQKPGDTRIQVIWSRIITPEGINISMNDAEMTDAMGRSGLTGDVDNRFFERYGMALLVSTIAAAAGYGMPVRSQGQAVIVQSYGGNLAQVSGQILEKNINIKPVVSIPAGARILISPNKDIWFKPPQEQQVEVVAFSEQKGESK